MPKQSLASIAKSVRTAMKKHSPEILTGIGTVSYTHLDVYKRQIWRGERA